MGRKWHAVAALGMAYAVAAAAVADGDKGLSFAGTIAGPEEASSPRKLASLYGTTYHHVWPVSFVCTVCSTLCFFSRGVYFVS